MEFLKYLKKNIMKRMGKSVIFKKVFNIKKILANSFDFFKKRKLKIIFNLIKMEIE